MSFVDPFYGYSFLLRAIVYVVVPLFLVLQVARLRWALHVFQLEGYKRDRFLAWCRATRARFLRSLGGKKPLVMTGRAWRILIVAVVLNAVAVLVLPGIAHLAGGAPYDLVTWALMTALTFAGPARLLVLADVVLTPVQNAINASFTRRARARLDSVAPVVVGVTGSFGKTSTKFAIAGLLGGPSRALATPGSYNTPLGVVRAINEGLLDDHRFLVVEMGAYRIGDIAELCAFVRPRIGVLTSIGPAHLERFGSMDAIRQAKYEIVQSLPSDGVAVMDTDDPEVRALADATTHVRVVRYGRDPAGRPDVTARDHRFSAEGTTATIAEAAGGEIRVKTRLLGEHAIRHVLAGVAVARLQGIPLADLERPIADLQPVEHRLQLIRGAGGVTVIDDAYNSNPAGAAAALDVLAGFEVPEGGKVVVVTPGMVELGELQEQENERLGRHVAAVADIAIFVGKVNRAALVRGAGAGSSTADVVTVDTLQDATEHLSSRLSASDVVLFENDLPDQYEV